MVSLLSLQPLVNWKNIGGLATVSTVTTVSTVNDTPLFLKEFCMDNIFSDVERVVDALTGPLGDYAPRRRHLMVDYKDKEGIDLHQEVLVLHPNGATDESLVQSIKEQLPGLTAIAELLPGDKWSALYIALALVRWSRLAVCSLVRSW